MMHSALLIDEIIQVVLEHCADWPAPQYRRTLAQLARCCKAWKDPALDRLWRKLDSVDPLERLADGKSVEEFDLYATRVKHILFSRAPRLPMVRGDHAPLPNLKSIILKDHGCSIPSDYLLCSSLEELEIDLRRTRTRDAVSPIRTSDSLSTVLQNNPSLQTSLRFLRVKGLISTAFNDIMSSFQSLRSLVLLAGNTLNTRTLAALGSLSNLQDIYVHASHVDAGDFSEAVSRHVSQPFASLRSLRIRAQRSLICAILEVLPPSTLTSLYLETEEPAQGPSAWQPTFTLIAVKAADTLVELTLDQILDPEEIMLDQSDSSDTRFALDTLQPLSKLRALHRLTIDAMLLPDFTDEDIDQMAGWWPRLEHLNLGSLPDVQEHAENWVPKVTVEALRSLAKRCPSLRTLTIPLDVSSCKTAAVPRSGDKTSVVRQKTLERLFVGTSPAEEDIGSFVRSVVDIFPCVREIECTSAERPLSLEVQVVFKD
ncbi:uncharacterized protein PHACADRAFT_130044, partial [Phanerochaete carnosa HHB-10118-sp]